MLSAPKTLLALPLLFSLCNFATAASRATDANSSEQDYVVKVWDADNGLAEASVTDVAETPEGYLWIGTLFGSVLRFDGSRFVSFNSANTPELSSKWGGSRLIVDRQGRLWISQYEGGLITWDKNGFRSALTGRSHPERLLWSESSQVIFIDAAQNILSGRLADGHWTWQTMPLPDLLPQSQPFADAKGRVWFLRKDRTIRILETGKITTVALSPEMEGQRVAAIAATAAGSIWVGTDHLLARWRDDHFELMTPTNGEPVLNVRIITPSGDDSIWVQANGRMRRCGGRQWLAESMDWDHEMGRISVLRFLHGDAEGGLWSAVGDSGLIHVQPDGNFQRLTTRDGLPSNTILFAYQDESGSSWTGYQRGGLVHIGHHLFRVIGKREGLNESLINSVCEDGNGGVWIGTHDGGIGHYVDGTCTNVSLSGIGRMQDSIVTVDAAGRIWLAADGAGLFMSQDEQIQSVATPAQLGGSYVRLMLPARDGRLWLATVTSIVCVTNGALSLQYSAKTAGDHPTSMSETADGTIWVGTLSGLLLRWNGKEFAEIAPPDQSSLGRIWAMWSAPDGSLWAGTEQGGLLHWREGRFWRYTMKEGLPSDCISQIIGDGHGNLWLGTRAGIVRIAEKALGQFENGQLAELPTSVYGQMDGLPTIGNAIMFQPNCWRGRDGTVFFAMANSVAAVTSERVRDNPSPPTVVLEELRADEKPVPFGRSGAILIDASISNADQLSAPVVKIGPGGGELEFRFTGLGPGPSACQQFKYKLEGSEHDWNEAGEQRRAVYLHVPPGKYTFRVRASSRDGVWNQGGVLLTLILQPHFYQTTWFRLVVGLAAGTGLVLAVVITMRRRMRVRLEHLERQRAMDRERTRIAQDLHDELGAGLTEIGLLSGLLQNPSRFTERNLPALERIALRCRGLVAALDEIVWAVNPRNDSVDSLGDYFCLYAQGFLEPSSIRCELEMQDVDLPYSLNSEQRHNLFLAFKEALTNAVRHSGASEVRIRIFLDDSTQMFVCVEDNGRGLPEIVSRGSDGLINLHQRMARLGGHCEISNLPGGGVSVRLSLPLLESQPTK